MEIKTIKHYSLDSFNSECVKFLKGGWVPLFPPQVHTKTEKGDGAEYRSVKFITYYVQQWVLRDSE